MTAQEIYPDEESKVQSQFLPGTQIAYAWDSTMLGTLKSCPRKYYYSIIEGWESPEESVHLRFGIEYHQALQEYDISRAAGIPHDDAVFDTVRELLIRTEGWHPDRETRAGKYKNRDSLLRSVIWYLEHFVDDPAKTFILSNGKPAVELSFRFELGYGPDNGRVYVEMEDFKGTPFEGVVEAKQTQPYLLCGHLDRVVDFNGDLFVMDRKTTTSTLGDYYFAQYEPNNQMTLYTMASQIILDSPVRGVIIDAVQLMVDSTRFVRGFTFRTKDQLDEWMSDLSMWLRLAEAYAVEGQWPQNETSCGDYGGCKFREVCSKSPSVREIYLKSKFVKLPPEERWNPLKSR